MTNEQFTRAIDLRKQMEELMNRDDQLSGYIEIIRDAEDMTSPRVMQITMKIFDLDHEAARKMMFELINKVSKQTTEGYNALRKEFQNL
jgi:hypothetical protein